jgi:hypothetical protein
LLVSSANRIVLDLCERVDGVDDGMGQDWPTPLSGMPARDHGEDDQISFNVQAGPWPIWPDSACVHMWDLPRGFLRSAYRQHPACGVHRTIPELIRREARHVPEGRFALLRSAGMDRLVQFSPTRRYRSEDRSTSDVMTGVTVAPSPWCWRSWPSWRRPLEVWPASRA